VQDVQLLGSTPDRNAESEASVREFAQLPCFGMGAYHEALYQSRGHSLQKQARLKTPSLRFPLLAGGTEPVRGSPREAGGT
jgi:hypothetical protein